MQNISSRIGANAAQNDREFHISYLIQGFSMHAEVKTQVAEQDSFLCKALQTGLRVESCLSNYVEANALALRNSVCFKCNQGAEVRAAYANS